MANVNKNAQIDGMIDVSAKDVTRRTARASAELRMGREAFHLLLSKGSPKGDAFETAKIAGILAAKATPSIIPMCHPLELGKVSVTFAVDRRRFTIRVDSEVVCLGRTGVEMEALMAASAAALTLYDMMKWADKTMVIASVKLNYKSGGRSGVFVRG